MNNKIESWSIYQTLNSKSMYKKYLQIRGHNIDEGLNHALAVLFTKDFTLMTGSAVEGTAISQEDYGKYLHSMTPRYISDVDFMHVLVKVWVTEEGDTLPQRFDNHIYLRAERGQHTTDGFRKLRSIHCPEYLSEPWARDTHVEHGYISSSKLLSATLQSSPLNHDHSFKTGLGTQGPSHIIEAYGYPADLVPCFYVKTWPKEADSWLTRQTHWPDRKLKDKIRQIGYLLVPTGNSNSQESDLEWRCSFSIAEKILFQSLTNFQRCTFIMLKALLKEYLPSHINTDGEKQLLSTYHIKTLFLWCLEESKVVWEPEDILGIIDHLLDVLVKWINRHYIPHYFISSVNLLGGRWLHWRGKSLICFISKIRNNLLIKMNQSQFFMGQEINHMLNDRLLYTYMHYFVFRCITGKLQMAMHHTLFTKMHILRQFNLNSYSKLIEGLISIKLDVDPQLQHLYTAMYSDPVYDKVLKETVPGSIDQYRGCLHLAKYCMAARVGHVLPGVLHTAESLLKDTLHLDPCSGHVKLSCLYITTGEFIQAMDRLHAAENNFYGLFIPVHKNITFTLISPQEHLDRSGAAIMQIFQKWVDGQVPSDIVVTWPEYITVPDLLQFELIHESTKHITDHPNILEYEHGKMVGLDSHLQWPPLSFIKLLTFVCAFYSDRSIIISLMENLVADLIASSLSLIVLRGVTNDIYTVFNMAAWCYVKIKKNNHATRMVMMAIETSSETDIMKRSAFSHHFLAYIIEQCLAKGNESFWQTLLYNISQ